jgi:hypothetical protein
VCIGAQRLFNRQRTLGTIHGAQCTGLSRKTPSSLEPFTKLEIEHILPDNPAPELRATWLAANPNAGYDDYKNRLGNLTLLEKPINIVVGNDFYTAKQDEYRKRGNYLTRSLAELTKVGQNTSISRINEKLEAFPVWDTASIEKRHVMLISLTQDVWRITPIAVPGTPPLSGPM